MFTHLFNLFVSGIGTMPGLMVYAAVALWIGAENIGIPLPLELMLLFSGSLIAFGELSFLLVLGTVVLASLAFAALAYAIGRSTGTSGVLRVGRFVGLTQTRIDHIDTWLRRRGALGVILARIIPGIRLFSSYVMGIADITPATFAVGTLIGSACYITIWLIIGTLLGSNYRAPLRYLDRLGLYGLVLIVLALAAVLVIHQVLGRRNLRHLATQHALQASAPAVVDMRSQAGAAALLPARTPDPLQTAMAAPHMPVASVTSSPEEQGMPSPGARPLEPSAMRLVQPVWPPLTATTTRVLRQADTLDRRIAADVGLRGPDLQAQFRAPWPSWIITLVSAVWVELATIALIVSIFAHRYATFPVDGSLAASIQRLRGTPWAMLIYPAGDLQWYLPTAIAYVFVLGTLLGLRLYLAALFTALSSFGTDLINVVINVVVARPRPHGVSIPTLTGGRLGSASFPSGHVAHTIGLYGFVFFLCILAMRAQPRLRPWLVAIQAVCLYFILFVGASRILEGQHWPSDVAGGYLVGILVLALVIVLYHLTAMRANARHAAIPLSTKRHIKPHVASP